MGTNKNCKRVRISRVPCFRHLVWVWEAARSAKTKAPYKSSAEWVRIGRGSGADWARIGRGSGADWARIERECGLGAEWVRIGCGMIAL